MSPDQPEGAPPVDGSPVVEPPDVEPPDAGPPVSERSVLAAGDLVQFVDHKGRRYQATLRDGAQFHTQSGFVEHTDVIGLDDGSSVQSSRGQAFVVLRPTLADFVFKMPRGAQVIYPKDLGPMLLLADIGPGDRVLESGVGSGALSMVLLRAGADVTGYELREDFAERAQANVGRFLGDGVGDRYRVQVRNTYDGIDETDLDRVVLDLPEPWNVVPHATGALRPGGIIVAYTPSVVQVVQFREALEGGPYTGLETIEVLHRSWHVEPPSVRPDHRMVAHTGFLTVARRLADPS